jgi:predicted Zn finger-like uncharacterized protein
MYTQCPECSTAFRVTADVLKQAAGKVRCGGCGHAFNALEYLSETKPEQKPARSTEEDLPELKPEPLSDEGSPPKAISAEQSAALLKTLDELAGSDIRIEDTGVEWRVLDEDELGEAADDAVAMDVDVEDQPEIDEILEASPTPVDQFLTDTPPQIDAPEIFAEGNAEPSRTPVEELRFDDNTPLPDDFHFGAEASYGSVSQESAPPEPEPVAFAEPQPDLDLSEPDEWTDILDEFEGLVGDLADDEDPLTDEEDTDDETPLDMDSQFALQAEAMGIELSGERESLDVSATEDLDTLLQEPDAEERDIEDLLEEEIVDEIDYDDAEDVDELVEPAEDVDELEPAEDVDELELAEDVDELEPTEDVDELEPTEDVDESGQLELIDEADDAGESEELTGEEEEVHAVEEHYIPPLTEEEQTINMQIDQDLLAVAVEDEDGFASTIIIPEDAAVEPWPRGDKGRDDEFEAFDDPADTGTGFETIIMEGEFVRSGLDREKLAADAAAAAELAAAARAEREAQKAAGKREINYGMVAGFIVLLLLLLGQFVHQSRNTLATIPAFNDTVGPLYRAIGQPLSPDWDITGWRFEATQGQADEDNENLTIYSRIGNKSDRPLPYPLISVSLTDRFEDVIGNRVLDPGDYLANDLDPRHLVQPGDTFNAAITIHSPDAGAVSFRLRACYRSEGGQLRCKEDGFK